MTIKLHVFGHVISLRTAENIGVEIADARLNMQGIS